MRVNLTIINVYFTYYKIILDIYEINPYNMLRLEGKPSTGALFHNYYRRLV